MCGLAVGFAYIHNTHIHDIICFGCEIFVWLVHADACVCMYVCVWARATKIPLQGDLYAQNIWGALNVWCASTGSHVLIEIVHLRETRIAMYSSHLRIRAAFVNVFVCLSAFIPRLVGWLEVIWHTSMCVCACACVCAYTTQIIFLFYCKAMRMCFKSTTCFFVCYCAVCRFPECRRGRGHHNRQK